MSGRFLFAPGYLVGDSLAQQQVSSAAANAAIILTSNRMLGFAADKLESVRRGEKGIRLCRRLEHIDEGVSAAFGVITIAALLRGETDVAVLTAVATASFGGASVAMNRLKHKAERLYSLLRDNPPWQVLFHLLNAGRAAEKAL